MKSIDDNESELRELDIADKFQDLSKKESQGWFQDFQQKFSHEKTMLGIIKGKIREMRMAPEQIRQILKKMITFEPAQRETIFEVLKVFEEIIFNNSLGIDVVTINQLNRLLFKNIEFEQNSEMASKKKTCLLPKNYGFTGEFIRSLPIDSCELFIGKPDNVVFKANYKQGVPDGNMDISIGSSEHIKFKFSGGGRTPKSAEVSYGLKGGKVAKVSLDHAMEKKCKPLPSKVFEENSWVLKKEFI
jgi:hypothetical protein